MSDKKLEEDEKEFDKKEFDRIFKALEEFQERFFMALAGTDKYEIVPTLTEVGDPLTEEQYSFIKTECSRLGLTILYKIDTPNGNSLFINIKDSKTGYIDEGIH